jgi:hypothetical protein
VDPRTGMDDVQKRKFLTLPGLELRPSLVQPVASRYTDYAIPAHYKLQAIFEFEIGDLHKKL